MSTSASEVAEEPITYKDLPTEHKKKYDDLKAILGLELIGSFEKTRSHGVRFKDSHHKASSMAQEIPHGYVCTLSWDWRQRTGDQLHREGLRAGAVFARGRQPADGESRSGSRETAWLAKYTSTDPGKLLAYLQQIKSARSENGFGIFKKDNRLFQAVPQ
ncbi:hypothetical protein QYE76_031118 [Lolium multiflorum]|uniref:Uncharacterized protein n=1 Tax=Lolium multiflorum TaxID=4521 RepID=A0AAD8VJW3_LOLMU|nr:hypothetical protein QYE76_031118 [Lolium multiflorum]